MNAPEFLSWRSCGMGTALQPDLLWSGGPTLAVRHRGLRRLVDVTPTDALWDELWHILAAGNFWTWTDVAGAPFQKDGWRSEFDIRWQGRTQFVKIRLAGDSPDQRAVEPTMRKLLYWIDTLAKYDPAQWDEDAQASDETHLNGTDADGRGPSTSR